jgi:hypothetical protein
MHTRHVGLMPAERFERLHAGTSKPKETAWSGVSVEPICKQPEGWGATHDNDVLSRLGIWSKRVDIDFTALGLRNQSVCRTTNAVAVERIR